MPTPRTLRQLRERARLSPADVERETGGAVRRGALNAIERGKVPNPTFNTVNALAQVLKTEPQAVHHAIKASVAARATMPLAKPGPKGPRPRTSEPMTIDEALTTARQLCTALEALATNSTNGASR